MGFVANNTKWSKKSYFTIRPAVFWHGGAYIPLKDKMFFDFELIGNKMSDGLAEPVGLVCI